MAAGLFAIYLLAGFFALPAIVKWQLEKQVSEKLGHRINIAEVRFNPPTSRFKSRAWRSPTPRQADGRVLGACWSISNCAASSIGRDLAEARLEAPSLQVSSSASRVATNFSELLDRLANDTPDEETGSLPRFVVQKISLSDGDIEYADSLLRNP